VRSGGSVPPCHRRRIVEDGRKIVSDDAGARERTADPDEQGRVREIQGMRCRRRVNMDSGHEPLARPSGIVIGAGVVGS
jgi:hypothetical protein